MPSLSAAQQPAPDNYVRVERPQPSIPSAGTQPTLTPGQNPNMRCPVPQTQFSSDARQQFYRGNTIPQFRTFSPPPLTSATGSSGGGSVTSVTNTTTNKTVTVALQPAMASITTPVLNPGDNYTGVVTFSRIFDLIQMTTTSQARVRLYATAQAQTIDLSRSSAQAPSYGTTQGLIAGVSLDTAPFLWLFTPPATGVNGDSPTSPSIYVTITNISSGSTPITVSFTYLPLQS